MIHFETSLAANLLSVLLSASLRAAVLGWLAWAMLKVVRGKAAAVRHAVWTAVLLAMLLMPLLRTALPPFRLPLLPFSSTQSTLVQPAHSAPSLAEKMMSVGNTSEAGFSRTEARSIPLGWPVLMLALYVAGALLFLARQLIGHFFVRGLVRSSQLFGATDAATLKHLLPLEAKIPDLRFSSQVHVPIVVGVLKPSIILPADWSAWKEEKLTAVLAHEFSHVQRGDPLIRFLSSLNRCLYWFHPMAWWLDRYVNQLAEELSDDSALVAIADRREYAEVLLGFAATASKGAGRVSWAGLAMATTSHLGARIEKILCGREAAADRLARRTLLFLLIAAPLAVISTAAVELTGRQQTQSAKSDSISSTGNVRAQSFAGTWQGVWHDTWMGSQSSLSVTLSVKAADGKLSGVTSSTLQSQPVQKRDLAPSLEVTSPHLAPPPPPPPPTPPTGTMLDPRIEGRTLVFKVKAPDAKAVDFRLTIQASGTGTLKVTFPTHFSYPDFEMKRVQ
jgi:beta-lactamase regulating signal transducer with metallopeptidase domain